MHLPCETLMYLLQYFATRLREKIEPLQTPTNIPQNQLKYFNQVLKNKS